MKHPNYIPAILLSAFMMAPPVVSAAYDNPADNALKMQTGDNAAESKASTGEGRSDSSSKAEYVDDATITQNVKKAIDREPQIANQSVQIETKEGVVTVSGKVNDERFKGKIIQVVQGVKGVKSVKNNMTLGNS